MNMNRRSNTAIAIAITAIFGWSFLPALAAMSSIFMETEPLVPTLGREFVVRIFVASEQPVNGYEISVSFRPNELELVRTDTARSLIDIWPKQPLVYTSGDVNWKGASIEPFAGERGELLALHFRALPGISTTTLNIRRETALYLANGKGTKVVPELRTMVIEFAPPDDVGTPTTEEAASPDDVPPDISFLALENDPITPGQKLFSFQARDRESGIATVERRDRSWFLWSDWRPTRNPDALTAGVWEAELRITDHAGNVARAVARDWRTAGAKSAIVFLVIALITGIVRITVIRRRRRE